MMQTIDTGDAPAAPQSRPQLVPEPAPARKNTTEELIDSALDFLSSEGKPPANDNAEPARRSERPDDGPGEEEEESDEAATGPENDEGDEQDDSEAGGEDEAHTKGSLEDPYTVNDLPKDKYIEIKVDGEKKKIPIAELANGYIAQETFSKRINQTKALTGEAQQAVKRAGEFRERLRQEFQTFVSDPQQLYDFFLATEEREKVLEEVAHRYADLLREFRAKPEQRLAFARERDRKRLEAEREHFHAQQRAELEAKQRAEADARARAIFQPGWEEGLKRAGFPVATRELWEEVLLRVNQRAASGAQVTSDDVATFVERACKLLELPPKNAKKPTPAPRRATPAPRERRSARGGADWGAMPPMERRKSPDYFLKDLKPRDWR